MQGRRSTNQDKKTSIVEYTSDDERESCLHEETEPYEYEDEEEKRMSLVMQM